MKIVHNSAYKNGIVVYVSLFKKILFEIISFNSWFVYMAGLTPPYIFATVVLLICFL
jgi:hypothetical protein